MGGGGSPKYPPPSEEELALQRSQNQLLQQQMAMIQAGQQEQNLIAPYLYQQMGLKPTYDASGKMTGFEELPGFAEQQQQARDIQGLTLDFSKQQLDYSKQQLGIQKEQGTRFAEQQRIQELLNPFTYEAMGVTPKYDEAGKIIGFDKAPITPEQERAKQLTQLEQERAIAALKGELPIDPTTTRELGQQEQTLRATLAKQLGPGWETSTSGREAMERFGQTKAGVLAGAQRGELTLAEQLGSAREASGFARDAYRQALLRGNPLQAPQAGQAYGVNPGSAAASWMDAQKSGLGQLAGRQFAAASQLGGAYSGTAQNLNTLGQWRGQQFQSNVAKSQQEAQEQQTYGAAAGAVASVAAAAALISTRRAKKDITPTTGARSLRLILEGAS